VNSTEDGLENPTADTFSVKIHVLTLGTTKRGLIPISAESLTNI
jgi:hypothetical protein